MTTNKHAVMTPYELVFISKCTEYGLREDRAIGMLKMAGPSLRDRAAAGVPGASAKLRAQEEAKAYRKAHPNPLGSLSEQKAYIKQQGSKTLDSLTPEQRSKFWADAQKFQADALRARVGLASLAGGFGGLGLAGAAGLEGAGEALASKVERKSTGSAIGRGVSAGAGTFVGGKALQGALQGAARLGKHAITGAKHVSPALRRFALRLNARDPFHNNLLTRVLNHDVSRNSKISRDAMYLSHATGVSPLTDRVPPSRNSALPFVKSDNAWMPSMGLAPETGVNWYGNGMSYGGITSRTAHPVNYFFDSSVLRRPRVSIYASQDVNTPGSKTVIRTLGEKINDASARDAFYEKLYRNFVPRRINNSSIVDTISLPRAKALNIAAEQQGKIGRVFEVKPFRDIPVSDVRSVSIGLGRDKNLWSDPRKAFEIKSLEDELGTRGIPYYFTDAGAGREWSFLDPHMFHRVYRDKRPPWLLDAVNMARNFAPPM